MLEQEPEYSLSPQSQAILARSNELAACLKPTIYSDGSVPLLLALTEDPKMIDVLAECGITVTSIDRQFPIHTGIVVKRTLDGLIDIDLAGQTINEDVKTTSETLAILADADYEARHRTERLQETIEPIDLLYAIIRLPAFQGPSPIARIIATAELSSQKTGDLHFDLTILSEVKEEARELAEEINRRLGYTS